MSKHPRIDALDILRGLALAGMLLVNNPGSWSHVYSPLLHAPWHGITPTDLVFPFFLFVVGAAMAYSFQQQIKTQQFNWLNIYRRTFLLIGIGILLSAFPFTKSIEQWRLLGVLQRIGLCYFIVACLLRFCSYRQLSIIAGMSLIAYWLILASYGNAPYAQETNLARSVDLLIMGESHMWQGLGFAFDPEGLLSTLPAAVTCLSGYLITVKLQQCQSALSQIKMLLLIGLICLIVAIIWQFVFPINKSLWTSTYVLISTGIACFTLSLIIACWDIWKIRFGLHALKIYGANPILIFVLAGIVARLFSLIKLEVNAQSIPIKTLLYESLATLLPAKIASLTFAICFMLSFFLLAYLLYRKKIFVKL